MPSKNPLQYLEGSFRTAEEAANHLKISFGRCQSFIDEKEYKEEQSIEPEALTARFARMRDLLI